MSPLCFALLVIRLYSRPDGWQTWLIPFRIISAVNEAVTSVTRFVFAYMDEPKFRENLDYSLSHLSVDYPNDNKLP